MLVIVKFSLSCLDNSKVHPQKKVLKEGDYVEISCEAQGSIYWHFNLGPLPKNSIAEGNKLYIQHFRDFNDGKYVCIGETSSRYSWTDQIVPLAAASLLRYKGYMGIVLQRTLFLNV